MKHSVLALAIASTLGLAAAPFRTIEVATAGSEALSALLTGTVLLIFAAAAKRVPSHKQKNLESELNCD